MNTAGADPATPPARELRVGISQSWAMPFARYAHGRLAGGILHDFTQLLAAQMQLTLRIHVIPPKRVEALLAANEVDVHCLVSPKWLAQALPASRWTEAVLRMDDVLLAAPGYAADSLDLDTVRDASVGLVLSYLYPALDAALLSGRLRREDATTQAQLFEKLQRGRSDFGVGNRLIADWFNKQQAPERRLKPLQTLASLDTACVLAPQPQQDAEQIKAAVSQLVRTGAMQKILQRYR